MDRKMSFKQMKNWRDSSGGLRSASLLICQSLECSYSKAEKLASGRYDRVLTASEQKALAELMNVSRDVLFPLRGERAS